MRAYIGEAVDQRTNLMLVAKASHCSPVGAAELLTLLQTMIYADDEKKRTFRVTVTL